MTIVFILQQGPGVCLLFGLPLKFFSGLTRQNVSYKQALLNVVPQ